MSSQESVSLSEMYEWRCGGSSLPNRDCAYDARLRRISILRLFLSRLFSLELKKRSWMCGPKWFFAIQSCFRSLWRSRFLARQIFFCLFIKAIVRSFTGRSDQSYVFETAERAKNSLSCDHLVSMQTMESILAVSSIFSNSMAAGLFCITGADARTTVASPQVSIPSYVRVAVVVSDPGLCMYPMIVFFRELFSKGVTGAVS